MNNDFIAFVKRVAQSQGLKLEPWQEDLLQRIAAGEKLAFAIRPGRGRRPLIVKGPD